MSRLILAIDPGPTRHAWAVLSDSPLRLMSSGRDLIADDPEEMVTSCVEIWCEYFACYGMAVGATSIDTCVAIGRLDERIGPMYFVTRIEVKRLVCRSVSAKDSNIRAAIIDLFGGPSSIKKGGQLHGVAADTWAAIAVGIAAMHPEVRKYVPAMER